MPSPKILLGWTTVDSAATARKLATGLINARLAACVQIDGPVTSHYVWRGKTERAKEWRLWVKFPSNQTKAIAAWLAKHHPYSTPQWLAVEATVVAESYRDWIMAATRQELSGARLRGRPA